VQRVAEPAVEARVMMCVVVVVVMRKVVVVEDVFAPGAGVRQVRGKKARGPMDRLVVWAEEEAGVLLHHCRCGVVGCHWSLLGRDFLRPVRIWGQNSA